MPQPSNEWEQTFEASIRREDEAAEQRPGYVFNKFLNDLRGRLMIAGLVLGVGLRWGFYWIAIAAFVVGAFMWWRHSHRRR